MKTSANTIHRQGLTLLEVLAIILLLGVLLVLLVPGLQNVREKARRSTCERNLVQLSLAIKAYANEFGHYPIGSINPIGPIESVDSGFHHNWASGILPMMNEKELYQSIDRSRSVYASENAEPRSTQISGMRCPSASDQMPNTTSYAAIISSLETPIDEDNDGPFRLNIPTSEKDIVDGLSYTVFLGEKLSLLGDDLGWISGTRSSLRNGAHGINEDRAQIKDGTVFEFDRLYVGGLSSHHFAGAYLLLGSGEYQFRESGIDPRVLQQMCSRADMLDNQEPSQE